MTAQLMGEPGYRSILRSRIRSRRPMHRPGRASRSALWFSSRQTPDPMAGEPSGSPAASFVVSSDLDALGLLGSLTLLASIPPAEGWPSGLRRTLGKRVCVKAYRGFESHSLRHASLQLSAPLCGTH